MKITNWLNGQPSDQGISGWLDKYDPHSGELMNQVAISDSEAVALAVRSARSAYPAWSELTAVKRGQYLAEIVSQMKMQAATLADCIAKETGKPPQDAQGEVGAAILQGEFFAGEGMRLYARTLTSGMPGKYSHTVRQPLGVAALIVPANTPIANIAWKVFPALISGNTVVLKASEDSPSIAQLFAELCRTAGLPDGVLNVIQGNGSSGAALVESAGINVVSFTGSTQVGRWIAESAGRRLLRVSLELGGKNPLVVCDDADIEQAVHWASLSAFSNAGQRCAAASRLIVFRSVYEDFRDRLIAKANSLCLGVEASCDLGPVINKRQHERILAAIDDMRASGATVLCGGGKPESEVLAKGYYIEPTLIEGLTIDNELSDKELFGPVAALYPVDDMDEALMTANATAYGLTSAIHTKSVDRAMWFAQRVRAGLANINLGTYGSEPHMPFGGLGASGNGTREPGVEALDVYTELKNISFLTRSDFI